MLGSTVRLLALVAVTALVGCSSGGDDDPGQPAGQGQDITARKPPAKGPARFRQLKQGPTSKTLKPMVDHGNKIDQSFVGTYKYLKPTTEGTDPVAREKRIKEVMHKFMCGFFDESIDIAHRTGAGGGKAAVSDLDFGSNADDSPEVQATISAVEASTGDRDLDVMSGTASGNNTMGNVLGVYDTKNNEVTFFGFTNCGSDD